jgi:hypothetical protein
VFGSIGLESCVAEAYSCSGEEVLSIVEAGFACRDETRTKLKEVIPGVKADILNALEA